jgi:hypothetical protein
VTTSKGTTSFHEEPAVACTWLQMGICICVTRCKLLQLPVDTLVTNWREVGINKKSHHNFRNLSACVRFKKISPPFFANFPYSWKKKITVGLCDHHAAVCVFVYPPLTFEYLNKSL